MSYYQQSFFERHLGTFLAFFAIAVVVGVPTGTYLADRHDCRVYSRTTGVETQYNWGTCYVKQGTRFYPRDELKIRNATHGE